MRLARLVHFELRAMRAQRLVMLALTGLAAACAYAVSYGGTVYQQQVHVIDSLQLVRAQVAESLQRDLGPGLAISADTGFEGRSGITNLDDYVAVVAAKAPHPLQALTIGQADVLPYQRAVSARSLYYDGGTIRLRGSQPEIRNAEKQLAGNFDLTFVVVYLVPLIIIALCHNALSDDEEFGTLALIRATPVPVATLVLARIALRSAVVLTILALCTAVALATTARGAGVEGLSWWLVSSAYALFWSMLSAVVSARRLGGGTSAMLLLGLWLGSVVLIPAAVSAAVDVRHPVPARAELLSAAREQVADLWDAPRETTFGPFWAAYPALQRDTVTRRPSYAEHFSVWHFNLTRLLAPVAAPYDTLASQREHTARLLGLASPTLLTAGTLAALARSDLRSSLAYEDSLRAFQHRRAVLADSLTFTASVFTPAQFGALERWNARTDFGGGAISTRVATCIALLFGATVLGLGAAHRQLRRRLP